MLRAAVSMALVSQVSAFSIARTATRRLTTLGALPPHLSQVKTEVEAGDALLCDVREPGEWEAGHFQSAIHVPLSGLQNGQCPQECLDATKRLYLHCAAGIRVHPAAECLARLGCDDVVPLNEGAGELYQLGFDALAE